MKYLLSYGNALVVRASTSFLPPSRPSPARGEGAGFFNPPPPIPIAPSPVKTGSLPRKGGRSELFFKPPPPLRGRARFTGEGATKVGGGFYEGANFYKLPPPIPAFPRKGGRSELFFKPPPPLRGRAGFTGEGAIEVGGWILRRSELFNPPPPLRGRTEVGGRSNLQQDPGSVGYLRNSRKDVILKCALRYRPQ